MLEKWETKKSPFHSKHPSLHSGGVPKGRWPAGPHRWGNSSYGSSRGNRNDGGGGGGDGIEKKMEFFHQRKRKKERSIQERQEKKEKKKELE
jgi:hypothetical protein